MGVVGIGAGLYLIYDAPATRVTVLKSEGTLSVTRRGLLRRVQEQLPLTSVRSANLVQGKDIDGEPVYSLRLELQDGREIPLTYLWLHDSKGLTKNLDALAQYVPRGEMKSNALVADIRRCRYNQRAIQYRASHCLRTRALHHPLDRLERNMSLAIETNNLTKLYGAVRAVDTVSLRVGEGEVYGFLGLNGAGKTTTIRALLGMIRPNQGTVHLLGQAVGPQGRGPWRHVGHMVENPAAYPELSVRENLEIARRLHGLPTPRVTSRVIERLGLAEYADRKAGALSTGNLKRLGLARALLHEPQLMLLDEPANGLDPAGVVEIRELLASLAREKGVTIFMSSHILTEVDRLATRIGIIHNGRLIEELESRELEALRDRQLVIRARDLAAAQLVLSRAGFEVTVRSDSLLLREARALEAPEAVAVLLVREGAPPMHLAVEQEDLESHFLRLTREAP